MSFSAQPLRPPEPPPRRVSATTVILSLAVAAFGAATIVLAVLHFRPAAPGAAGGAMDDGVLKQGDTVSPKIKYTDVVTYPIPYAAPPNLKLIAPTRVYEIVKQDETGFTWKAVAKVDDFKDEKRHVIEGFMGRDMAFQANAGHLKANLQIEDFTWEAKGVRPGKDTVFVQPGVFNTIAGTEGEVKFPIPYAAAPNVELTGQASFSVIIVESRPTGFKWKNVPQPPGPGVVNSGNVNWKAKGLRATESQQKSL